MESADRITLLTRRLTRAPDDPATYLAIGGFLAEVGQHRQAIEAFAHALQITPSIEAARGLWLATVAEADALAHHDRWPEALALYALARDLCPSDTQVLVRLAAAQSNVRSYGEAMTTLEQVVRIAPDHPGANAMLGIRRLGAGDPAAAIRCFEVALAANPRDVPTRIGLMLAQLRKCYADPFEIEACRAAYSAELERLETDFGDEGSLPAVADAIGNLLPFDLAYQGRCDRELQARYGSLVCRALAARYPALAAPPAVAPPAPGERIRVGFVSAFFHNHSAWRTPARGFIEHLDRSRFAVYGYHTGSCADGETDLARRWCDRFVEGARSFEQWCTAIREDRLHVLIFPEIGMDCTVARMSGLRLAPVQAASLGHPQTTGQPTIDYFLSSASMEPADGDAHYTEQLVRLPNIGIAHTPVDLPPERVTRAELGLRDEAVVYWCCQFLPKYLPQHDFVFARIAKHVPDAQFAFIRYYGDDPVTGRMQDRLRHAFAAEGLHADNHCVFLPKSSPARFRAISGLVDIYLDSLGWSGFNSALEAIEADRPVVTCWGDLMRGRHTPAVLTMMGLDDEIAISVDDYVSRAVQLGLDSSARQALSERIRITKHRLREDRECITALERFLTEVAGRADPRTARRGVKYRR